MKGNARSTNIKLLKYAWDLMFDQEEIIGLKMNFWLGWWLLMEMREAQAWNWKLSKILISILLLNKCWLNSTFFFYTLSRSSRLFFSCLAFTYLVKFIFIPLSRGKCGEEEFTELPNRLRSYFAQFFFMFFFLSLRTYANSETRWDEYKKNAFNDEFLMLQDVIIEVCLELFLDSKV